MTIRCFVAGDPIAQSRSPMIHGCWIAERGFDAAYEREHCPVTALPELLARVRGGEYRGGNLTAPLKEAALPLLDSLTPEAAAMGSVNTVFMRDGRLWGDNTDVPGYFAALDAAAPGWDAAPARILILGAGGAGRAIALGALRRNITTLRIANRTPARAQALAAALADNRAEPAGWPLRAEDFSAATLIINTTSLGMAGKDGGTFAWPASLAGRIASDIVYVPLETPFLDQARARGAHCVDGLGMLLHQAAVAFTHWFGVRPEVTAALRTAIAADITGSAPVRSGPP